MDQRPINKGPGIRIFHQHGLHYLLPYPLSLHTFSEFQSNHFLREREKKHPEDTDMALPPTPAFQSSNHPTTFTCNHHLMLCKSSNNSIFIPQNLLQFPTRRRIAITTALATVFLAREAISNTNMAASLDLRMTVPDQTLEEAEAGIRGHARELLEIKPLIDSELWGDTQKALRERSPYVRQDLYTIIQGKPGSLRPQLRKLYSKLFNSVTRVSPNSPTYAPLCVVVTVVWLVGRGCNLGRAKPELALSDLTQSDIWVGYGLGSRI